MQFSKLSILRIFKKTKILIKKKTLSETNNAILYKNWYVK